MFDLILDNLSLWNSILSLNLRHDLLCDWCFLSYFNEHCSSYGWKHAISFTPMCLIRLMIGIWCIFLFVVLESHHVKRIPIKNIHGWNYWHAIPVLYLVLIRLIRPVIRLFLLFNSLIFHSTWRLAAAYTLIVFIW